MNALLDALDCGFFRNPRGVSTVELAGGRLYADQA